ncbi:MAG: hypothetical protein QN720_05180 [Nitrososphaeraceae archaeon]|nr:hypothetical protein [Nitrososphaeraceae archaeon]MDW0332339.1 hypothetical protein [Nitrososphaeraceae archaeon]
MSGLENKDQEAIDKIASAIEDMVQMGVLRIVESNNEDIDKAVFSANFSGIVSNLMADRVVSSEPEPKVITTLMYHSLLIFMNEKLRVPKPMAIALGNDIEKYGEELEISKLIFNYAAILQKLFIEGKKEVLR